MFHDIGTFPLSTWLYSCFLCVCCDFMCVLYLVQFNICMHVYVTSYLCCCMCTYVYNYDVWLYLYVGMGGITNLLSRYGMSLILNNCGIVICYIRTYVTAHYYIATTLCFMVVVTMSLYRF